jgi:hypothetical protein
MVPSEVPARLVAASVFKTAVPRDKNARQVGSIPMHFR